MDSDKVAPVPDDDEDFEGDEEEEEEDDDSKTSEGGIIQALMNMQIKPRIKHLLPNFKHSFTNNMAHNDVFECYGIHLGIPKLNYFKGGFSLMGNYQQVPIRDSSCLELSTNGIDLLTQVFAPEVLRSKINQLDTLFDHVDSINPEFASYFVKPTDLVNTFMTDGVEGVVETLAEKKEKIGGAMPHHEHGILGSMATELGKQLVNKGGKEGIDPEVLKKFDKIAEDKDDKPKMTAKDW